MQIDDFRNPAVAELFILLGSNSRKKAVVFEGLSDEILWNRHIDFGRYGASPVSTLGKEDVLECVASALEKFPERIIGIVDKDYEKEYRLSAEPFSGIISSTMNDIELDILSLGGFAQCIEPSLSETNLRKIGIKAEALEELATRIAATIGALRFLNFIEGYGIDFHCYAVKARDINFRKFPNENWFEAEKLL